MVIAVRYVDALIALAPALGVDDLITFRAYVEVRAECLAEHLVQAVRE